MKEFIRKFIDTVRLKKKWQKGMVYGAAFMILLVFVFFGIGFQSGYGVVLDVFIIVLIAGLGFLLLFWIISFLFYIFKKIPIIFFAGLTAGVIALFGAQSLPDNAFFYLAMGIIAVGMLTGGILGILFGGVWIGLSSLKKGILIFGSFTALILNVLLFYWIAAPGSNSHLIEIEGLSSANQISAPNPLDKGDYSYSTFTYGSGISERIPAYGENADMHTDPVNISHLVSMDEWKSKIRSWYWGFELDTAPLNGQVWMPDGEGPFPLVLIVHGNHNMTDHSEGGYAYLGEHLASRGYIFVSIDQNFLNGYFTGSLKSENDARAMLLLKHLGLWHDWNNDFGSDLYQKIDLDNIALMGHSRGGEAAAIAAAMNQLERSPNNAINRYGFGYHIKSVIAISPSDGQYKMSGKPIELENINYLVFQGSHDADISRFDGLRQYYRISYSDSSQRYFKMALLIDRANHSQFNTIWSPYDRRIPSRFLLNQKPVLPEELQRETLLLYVSAFLDTTLKDADDYSGLFENYQKAGNWLPENLYMNQFQSSSFVPIANYEEDVDVLSAVNGEIKSSGLTVWKELGLKHRSGKEMGNQVVEIGWGENRNSYYSILIDDQVEISNKDSLSFGLLDIRDFNGELLDLTIEVKDYQGNTSSVILSDYGRLNPQFHVVFTKYFLWEETRYKSETEPILQTFIIPFEEFKNVNNLLSIEEIIEIRFNFNLVKNGRIYLDEVGIEGGE